MYILYKWENNCVSRFVIIQTTWYTNAFGRIWAKIIGNFFPRIQSRWMTAQISHTLLRVRKYPFLFTSVDPFFLFLFVSIFLFCFFYYYLQYITPYYCDNFFFTSLSFFLLFAPSFLGNLIFVSSLAAIVALRGLHDTAQALRTELDERGVAHLTASLTVWVLYTPSICAFVR